MLLQEIFKPEYTHLTEIYEIDIGTDSSNIAYARPPENFDVIGFILKLDEDNLINEELLDRVIAYNLTNMMIVIEIPSQWIHQELITPKYLIQLSMNVDFSISLLPPKHPLVNNSITHAEYIEVLRSFNDEMMKKPNFEKFVAPISNFMEYLMLEKLIGADHPAIKNFTPDNIYVQSSFSKYMTTEESNDFKDVLRESLYNFYGGAEQFDIVAKNIFEGIYNKSQEVFSGHVQGYLLEQQKLREVEQSTHLEEKENIIPNELKDE